MDNAQEFETLVDNLDSSMNLAGMGSKPRPPLAQPQKELTGNAKVEADWIKEVKKLLSDLDRDRHTFLQLRIKASGMIKDKTMGVAKEMVQAYKQAEDDILEHTKYIS